MTKWTRYPNGHYFSNNNEREREMVINPTNEGWELSFFFGEPETTGPYPTLRAAKAAYVILVLAKLK